LHLLDWWGRSVVHPYQYEDCIPSACSSPSPLHTWFHPLWHKK
jgi:hypothetical protein